MNGMAVQRAGAWVPVCGTCVWEGLPARSIGRAHKESVRHQASGEHVFGRPGAGIEQPREDPQPQQARKPGCPACGSTVVRFRRERKLLKALFFWPALLMRGKPECASCGHAL